MTEQPNLRPTDSGLPPAVGPAPAAAPTAAPQYATPVAPAPNGARFAISRGFVEILAAIAAIVLIGGVVFAAGRLTAPPAGPVVAFPGGTIPGFGGQQGPSGMMPGQGGQGRNLPGNGYRSGNGNDQGGFGRMGGLPGATAPQLKGQVVDVTADLLTLKLASGQTIQIALDGTTTYHKQATAAAGDVTKGSQVVVGLVRRIAGAGGTAGGLGGASDVTVVAP